MPRTARASVGGMVYHVINRGAKGVGVLKVGAKGVGYHSLWVLKVSDTILWVRRG